MTESRNMASEACIGSRRIEIGFRRTTDRILRKHCLFRTMSWMKDRSRITCGICLLIFLASCMVTASGVIRLKVDVQAMEADGRPISGADIRMGLAKLQPEEQPEAFKSPLCRTDDSGGCKGLAEYRFEAGGYTFGRSIDRFLPRKPRKQSVYFVEARQGDRLLCRSNLGALSQMQLWGEEPIELKVRAGVNPCLAGQKAGP